MKNEKALIIVLGVELNYLIHQLSMKVVLVGPRFTKRCLKFLLKKQICILDIQEQSITAKNVEVITAMYLMMVQNLLVNVIATMACA